MSELNEQQVALISAYIKQYGIAQNELHDDLLDHVCTSIENQMDEGKSFEAAFEQTIKLFGPGGLKQVQQQTFELLTEMNENMKKVAFSFGLTSTILLLAGTIFKLMHWPGAAVLIVLGAGSLAFVYLPLLLWHKLKESPSDESLMHISGFVGLTLTTIGVLFKIMHWPGASVTLMSGMGILAALYVPLFYFKKYKTSANKSITLSTGLVAMTCLILVFGLMSVRSSSEMNRGLALVSDQLASSNANFQNLDELYNQADESDKLVSLRKRVSQIVTEIEKLKTTLIAQSEGISLDQAQKIEMRFVNSRWSFDIPTHVLFDKSTTDEVLNIYELGELVSQFEIQMLEMYPSNMQKAISNLFPIKQDSTYEIDGEKVDWAIYHFHHVPLIGVVSELSSIELAVRNAELQVLLYTISQSAVSESPSGDQGASEAQSL